MDRGRVEYAAGGRPQDAAAVGDWLREKGWFVTRPEKQSAISGKSRRNGRRATVVVALPVLR